MFQYAEVTCMPGFYIWYDSLRHYPSADPQLYFRMFMDRRFTRQTISGHERLNRHKAMIYFGAANPEVKSIRFDSIPEDGFIYDPQTIGKDTVAIWFNMAPEMLPDTIKGEITYMKHDSINNLVEATDKLRLAWVYVESEEERKAREDHPAATYYNTSKPTFTDTKNSKAVTLEFW